MVPIQIAILRLSTSKTWRIIISISLIITFGAIYFSYARGAWLAVIAGFIANLLLRKKMLFPVFIFFFAFCAGAVLYLKANDRYLNFSNDFKSTIWHSNFREHLIATYQLKDASSAERFYRWVAGVRMIEDSWKTGLGPSTFYKNYKSYTQPAFKTWVSSNKEQSTVHNYYLLMIIEQGALGLILFLLLLGLVFWYIQKIYHRTSDEFWKRVIAVVASVMMMQCVLNFLSDLVETDKVGSIFYLCIAIVMIADAKTQKDKLPGSGY
jgi:O-antigen ligase